MALKILCLTKYGRLGASSRLRTHQYINGFEDSDFDASFSVQILISDEQLKHRYLNGGYGISILKSYGDRIEALLKRKKFDLIWIEKEALPWVPFWIERHLLRGIPYILDFDDALFHNYDLHPSEWVRKLFGRRIDKLMAEARLVMCGNDYLAQRANEAGASWVEIVPTVVDLARYVVKTPSLRLENDRLSIVWIGSPSTVKYLAELEAPLIALARVLSFKLRVIGAQLEIPGVEIECLHWSEDSEVASIAQSHIGVMPLVDSPWERGKCGYKLIQYMACGLPVIASPVGVNREIIEDGVNGFLAETAAQWAQSLRMLLENDLLRQKMGAAGRRRVEQRYCLQIEKIKVSQLLTRAAG